ncbi:EAL domain-containing protein [Methylovorus sp. MP688]|uniref:sensor domain-containing protein n=1 Tax=Methylovorus sp. (strain MP688) TaxID=887061 RepID=UPI0001EC48BD|nr:EAL domain-containing protein [Methylovorus sp. MP688]ADQ85801.1 diguanylate cyclase/phosphodiesterase with PAS/PAC sensor(s) [Methylovorus sp. MP688]
MLDSAQEKITAREKYLRTLLDNFPFMVWLKDTKSRLLAANTEYARVAGVSSPHELEGKTDFDFFDPELAKEYVEGDRQAMESELPVGTVNRLRTADGKDIWIESYKSRLVIDGNIEGTLGYARDVTDAMRREREYHSLIENSPNLIVRFDTACRRTFVNQKTANLYGVAEDVLLGKTPSEFPGGDSAYGYEQVVKEVFKSGRSAAMDLHWHAPDGNSRIIHIWLAAELDASGLPIAVIGMGQDVTETYEYQERIHHLAYFDTLTKLPNRALLIDRVEQTIAEAERHAYPFGLIMLDLDRFKEINDTLGHTLGDVLLCEVASRLEKCVRPYDTVARLGGDEFGILVSEMRVPENITRVADKVLQAFDQPFVVDGHDVFVTASLGIAAYPSDSQAVDDLLKYADSALFHAKHLGRNNFQFYSADLTIKAAERREVETNLRFALKKEEFLLHYQPLVDLATREIIGAEALLRWQHESGKLIMPDKFIGIAEETGLIIPIGEWVMRSACQVAVALNRGRPRPVTVAVNLSTRQFLHNDLVSSIQAILAETGCHTDWIKLEITESLLLENTDNIQRMLQSLSAMGLCISIDDFGTGYSALSYLHRFPVRELKIDRSFTSDITDNAERALIVQAIVSLARNLNKNVVAEGVETLEQADYLHKMGCPQAQGYLFSKPLPLEQFLALLG